MLKVFIEKVYFTHALESLGGRKHIYQSLTPRKSKKSISFPLLALWYYMWQFLTINVLSEVKNLFFKTIAGSHIFFFNYINLLDI